MQPDGKATYLNEAEAEASPVMETVKLYALAAAIVMASEYIGTVSFPLGPGKVSLMPLLWALLLGAALGLSRKFLPGALSLGVKTQWMASAILQPALMLFIAKLGLLVGASLPKLAQSGWALAFQEFGHFFGTILLGLPIALLLGIKREAIGATFSVGREPSLAIISERYGMSSPEGHGVLAEYITGTVFGAVFIAILAGLVTSLGIFDPRALAMGAGVGSGSMMAAASAAIAAQQTPEMAKEVAAFAAAANLLTTTIGTYFTLFLSLPAAVFAYEKLEPILGRGRRAATTSVDASQAQGHAPALGATGTLLAWAVAGALALAGNMIGYKHVPMASAAPGMLLMIGVVAIGMGVYYATGRKVPAVCWISLAAMGLTYPGTPYSAEVQAMTGKIDFLALTTPLLAFAGLSIAKDVPAFRRLGWRIVVTSLCANAGTFIFATIIAQFFRHG
jgi:hypothetical protein